MKRVRVLALFMLVALAAMTQLNAQHTRKVLMEEFTAMTCPPCAVYKPGIDEFAKTPNVVTVTYHQNYPAPGDPYNMLDHNLNVSRHNMYGLNSIPHVFIDGKEANLASAAALAADAAADLNSSSPFLITITEDRSASPIKVTVKVKNDGTDALSGANLQIMVVNYYADLSNYPDVKNNAYTRYTDFDYCLLKAMPTINGTSISLAPGEEKTFNYNYTMGSNTTLWNSPYVVAFVQDPTTKEVFQAESSFESVARKVSIESNDARYQMTARTKNVKKTFTLTNSTTSKLTVGLSLANTSAAVPTGWGTPSFSSTSVSVPAKGSATVDLSFTVGSTGGSYFNTVLVSPTGTGINVPTSIDFGYVAENTTTAVLTQMANETPGDAYTQLNALTNYRNEVAYIPAKTEVFEALSSLVLKTVIVPIDFNHRSSYVTDEYAGVARTLFENGTNMIFFGEVAFYNAMRAGYPSHAWADFMYNLGITGIKGDPTTRFTQNGSTITPKSFAINGTKGDPIGNNLSLTANTGTQMICFWTEDLTYSSGVNNIASFLAYGDQAGSHAGVHLETDKARAIILGFNLDGVASSAARQTLYKSMMEWMSAAPDLKITASVADTLNFGDVIINQSKTATAVLQNTGSADLTVTSVDLPTSSDFTLSWTNPIPLPMTIAPGGKQNLNISLTPNKEGAVEATCTISSNAKSGASAVLQLRANATTSSSVSEDNSADGVLSMRVSPNPINSEATIQYSVNSTIAQNLSMQVVDEKGVIVRELLSSDLHSAGYYKQALDVRGLASGSYRLILRSASSAVAAPFVVVK